MITDYYKDGVFQKRVETQKLKEEETEPIGEILLKPTLNDMVYEDNVKVAIELILNKIKGESMNLLLFGSAGTGKTTTAQMIAVETERPFIYLTGSQGTRKIKDMLINAKENAIVLIDEIHNIPEKVAEIIYPAVQDNEIYSNGIKIKLKNLMFIGTTTEPEKLPKPLLARFKVIELEELCSEKIITLLEKQGISHLVTNHLLNFTTNIRIINNLIEMVKLYGEVNEDNLVKVFRLKKINMYSGLSDLQEKYLGILKTALKPMGLRLMGLRLNKGEDYIKYEIEPDLIRKNMIFISSRGREIEPSMKEYGYEQLEKEREKLESKQVKYKKSDKEMAIKYLKDKEGITTKLGKRYLELVNIVSVMIKNNEDPFNYRF